MQEIKVRDREMVIAALERAATAEHREMPNSFDGDPHNQSMRRSSARMKAIDLTELAYDIKVGAVKLVRDE